MRLFSEADHPNTLAAAAAAAGPGGSTSTQSQDHLWVMLHNLGPVSCSRSLAGACHTVWELEHCRHHKDSAKQQAGSL
jgi:hypothetical protein